jgi:hypothetical protein
MRLNFPGGTTNSGVSSRSTTPEPASDRSTTPKSASDRSSTPKPAYPPPLPSCLTALSVMTQSKILQLLNKTTASTVHRRYFIEYQTPLTVNTAMLKFEFIKEMGAWYLDNVSVKKHIKTPNS